MSERIALYLSVFFGMLVANFCTQAVFVQNFALAFDRTFFQGLALLSCFITELIFNELSNEPRRTMKGFFSKLKGKVKKIENKSLLEAIVAGCVWASAADGTIDDDEIAKMMEVIECNPDLKHFGPEIGKTVSEMSKAFSASIQVGRTQAIRKIRSVASNDQDCEDVVAAILSVVAADGKIGPEEEKVVQTIAKELRVDLNQFA